MYEVKNDASCVIEPRKIIFYHAKHRVTLRRLSLTDTARKKGVVRQNQSKLHTFNASTEKVHDMLCYVHTVCSQQDFNSVSLFTMSFNPVSKIKQNASSISCMNNFYVERVMHASQDLISIDSRVPTTRRSCTYQCAINI